MKYGAGEIKSGIAVTSWLKEFPMENQMIVFPNQAVNLPEGSTLQWENKPDLIPECRNLIRTLVHTVDLLSEDRKNHERKLRNIRFLITSLSALKRLAEEHESCLADVSLGNSVDNPDGTRYIAVSTCELERFSEK
jgi:hypothetical protein